MINFSKRAHVTEVEDEYNTCKGRVVAVKLQGITNNVKLSNTISSKSHLAHAVDLCWVFAAHPPSLPPAIIASNPHPQPPPS